MKLCRIFEVGRQSKGYFQHIVYVKIFRKVNQYRPAWQFEEEEAILIVPQV